jgi:hypothetical protein
MKKIYIRNEVTGEEQSLIVGDNAFNSIRSSKQNTPVDRVVINRSSAPAIDTGVLQRMLIDAIMNDKRGKDSYFLSLFQKPRAMYKIIFGADRYKDSGLSDNDIMLHHYFDYLEFRYPAIKAEERKQLFIKYIIDKV